MLKRMKWTALAFGLVAACGSGMTDGPSFSQTVGTMGGDLTVTAAGDPQLAGTALLIPSGALSQDTEITIARGEDQAVGDQLAAGPSVRFLPDGLQFARPVTLTLPYDKAKLAADAPVFVAVTSATGRSELTGPAVHVDTELGVVTVTIEHFTDYQVVTGTPTSTDGGHVSDGGTDGGHDLGATDAAAGG